MMPVVYTTNNHSGLFSKHSAHKHTFRFCPEGLIYEDGWVEAYLVIMSLLQAEYGQLGHL